MLINSITIRTASLRRLTALISLLLVDVLASAAGAQTGTNEFRELARLRRTTSPFSMRMNLNREFREAGQQKRKFQIDCEPATGKWRIRDAEDGSCTVSDGEQLMVYDGRASAVVTSFDKPHGGFGFDPRLTGMTTFLSPDIRFDQRTDLISPEGIRHVMSIANDDRIPSRSVSFISTRDGIQGIAPFGGNVDVSRSV